MNCIMKERKNVDMKSRMKKTENKNGEKEN